MVIPLNFTLVRAYMGRSRKKSPLSSMHSVVLLPFFKLYSFFIQNCMNILQRSLYGSHKSREFHLPKSLSFQNQISFIGVQFVRVGPIKLDVWASLGKNFITWFELGLAFLNLSLIWVGLRSRFEQPEPNLNLI